ncbi:1-acyl-sn-glycerol-3-phosphate acyltransferase [Acetobacter aceti NRIC 0242]|uniref:1-acyl-sn-glycerol-3-phosphate acyltransferase n=1 Tax=Acetobacter aceti NBRC 14818 TaxID=887700 RepID=A0AB33IHV3_ACEAC|nr:lysophospholipid acyltransferase family protein [Acetobacter aceti]TCS33359.1 1-acyl-sn-glycerol-3-phosphate acyltransferase [Acetobacter aceti NBRC 14818]BCK77526.1 1-acyl-sn-glycerol-3-phosphate acyltransferase [Acetobacter aceti NBRC 14818]GAN56835.1 1-acyl-sn-glycerol-3-phosphate acyltransferase [Acetobacter aceti NBRC 14818]GBO80448.1 1-acyl-sn-glycerol-3-phosphate acyltransferase [Acetobacter aceti NRIC 0242]
MRVIRSALFRIYIVVISVLMGWAAMPVRLFWPRYAMPYAKLWARFYLAGGRFWCGIHTHIEGLEKLPKDKPFIIASQHQSAFDTLVWMNLVSKPTYVMKEELLKVPFVGPMLKLTGMIPVQRAGGSKAMRGLLKETERAAADGRQMIIFPEGTRMAYGETVPLKPGIVAMARHTGLPVYPVATNSGLCWPNRGFLKRAGTISVVIGDPVQAKGRGEMLQAIERAWQNAQPRLNA